MPQPIGGHATLHVSYDWRIVLLSVFVACLAAYTALDLTGPVAHAPTKRRGLAWTFAGTAALAIGVWSMHFIGMQAFRIAVQLQYNIAIVVASFVLAFAGAMISLWWLVRASATRRALLASSTLLGFCLAGMHYTGMAALAMPAVITYDPVWIAISVVIAVATSYAAFRLAGTFAARDDLRAFVPKAATAAMLGVAIVSVHYTGMAAARFYPMPSAMPRGFTGDADQGVLATAVTIAACMILGLFLLSASLNRRLREREREDLRFRMLASSSPNLVWTLDPARNLEYVNPRFTEYTGLAVSGDLEDVRSIFHPDDQAATAAGWHDALDASLPFKEEVRLRARDGTYRWYVVHTLPVRDDAGRVSGWLGGATDVHNQKQAHMVATFLEEATHALSASLDLYSSLLEIAKLLHQYCEWCEIQFDDVARVRRSVTYGDLSDALSGHFWTHALETEDRQVGRMTLVRSATLAPFSEIESNLFDHLAMRIAAAITHANLYEREHRVAQSFQQASLPVDLPQIPGVAFDAVYTPGGDEATVGGDWYDAVRLMDGRVIVSIGDVAGSGLDAAVTMGNVRQIIRGIAQVHADPVLMLDAADRALRIEKSDGFVTAFVGVLDPVARTFSYASAGHPPPMLRFPDGRVEMLSDGGLPLGLRHAGTGSPARTIELETGCVLVFYTDGLTEAQHAPVEGEGKLSHYLAQGDPSSTPSPARWIRRVMLDGQTSKDDVAILVMSINEEPSLNSSRRWTFDVTQAAAAQRARAEFASELRARNMMQVDVETAEVVLGELLGNAVRYAPGIVDVIADWSGSTPVVHVLDRGPGFHHIAMLPADLYSESGRGLFIVSAFTQDFRVTRRVGGGSHARAVLTLRNREMAAPASHSLEKALVGR